MSAGQDLAPLGIAYLGDLMTVAEMEQTELAEMEREAEEEAREARLRAQEGF